MAMAESGKSPRKTALRTFRLPADMLVSLEGEAESGGITLNSKLSSILTRYLEERESENLGLVTIPKQLLLSLLEATDDATLTDVLGKNMPTVWKSMMSYLYHDTSLDSAVRLAGLLVSRMGGVNMKISVEGKRYTVSYFHDYGQKFSLAFKALILDVLNEYHVQPKIEALSNSVTATFSVP